MFGDQTPSNIVWWPNILPFGHLVWCCLIVFDKIWRPLNIRSNNLKHFFCSRVWWAMFCSFGRLASQYIVNMFGHQTMFDGVWSPNISRLDRPLVSKFTYYKKVWKLSMPSNGCKVLLNLKSTDETLVVLPFKWKLLGSTFMWCCLLCCIRLF